MRSLTSRESNLMRPFCGPAPGDPPSPVVDGTLVPGQRLLLAAFGAGFTWGAVALDWGLDQR
jgi:hypothetical protein